MMSTCPTITGTDSLHSAHAATTAAPTLASLFRQTTQRHAHRTAVCLGSESLTYAALQQAADRVAASLRHRGVRPGDLVAIYLPRSLDMVITMLGVIQAGAAYLPIDPTYPIARVNETLKDASPVLVVTEQSLVGGLHYRAAALAFVAALTSEPDAHDVVVSPDSLAYVIYTSGSTGRPKGVMVTHHNVVRLLEATDGWFNFHEHDVWTMFHSFAFDFSVWEMWGSLLTGGRLVIVPFEVSRSPEDFHDLLLREQVTVLNQTPSAFSLLLHADAGRARLAVRYVIFGGEALNLRALLPWIARYGDAAPQLVNMYGITETTVHVTYRRIFALDAERETDSLIGQAIPDLQLHLLDDNLQPVAPGETGEICVGGAGVALGYLGRPELTAERFVADPFHAGARLYRSGDLARQRADGELVYQGRADRQVKINGFRIELGEIEAALIACSQVSAACVVPFGEAPGTQRLIAYVVPTLAPAELQRIREAIAAHLPTHMRPAQYLGIDAMPLTGNGKLDRAALPVPAAAVSTCTPHSRGTSTEDRIAAAWRTALDSDAFTLDDNFFDIGGTSMHLIAVRTHLQQDFNRTIPVTWMFECTTVRSLAARLAESDAPAATPSSSIQNRARQQREAFARMRATRTVA